MIRSVYRLEGSPDFSSYPPRETRAPLTFIGSVMRHLLAPLTGNSLIVWFGRIGHPTNAFPYEWMETPVLDECDRCGEMIRYADAGFGYPNPEADEDVNLLVPAHRECFLEPQQH